MRPEKPIEQRRGALCSILVTAGDSLMRKAHYQRLEELRLLKMLEDANGRSVLDIGCGHGKYMTLLASAGCLMTGVDVNAEQVAALRAQGLRVFTPDALPDGERYDYILMSHVIEHMTPDELVACMDRYLPFLKDDGRLIIITPFPGERFWHDFTHVRPYLPQSVRMAFGGIVTPSSNRAAQRMELEEIFFFKDSWRIRNCRAFYPFSSTPGFMRTALWLCNFFLAFLHQVSGGKLGATASWLGLYGRCSGL
jgi:SAM-dependent methyltransferase